jgi:hypothetical protein
MFFEKKTDLISDKKNKIKKHQKEKYFRMVQKITKGIENTNNLKNFK